MRYQLRDPQGASRSVAYLMLAAAPFVFVTGVVLVPGRSVTTIVLFAALCLILAAGGTLCRWGPERLPPGFWLIAPFFAVALITGLNLATHDASTGAQLFYLWPVIYAANFLSRTVTAVTMAFASGGNAAVVYGVLDPVFATADWVSLTVAFSMTALVVASLRTRNDRLRAVLETQAFADPLTGVANRRSLDLALARSVADANRAGEPVALLTLDIDHFKQINDTWGHAAGDQALEQVANVLRLVARRAGDVVARLGGDEFVVLLHTDRPGAVHAAAEIRTAVAAVTALPGGPPGVSIGVAVLPDHATTAADLLTASDKALYDAKSGGRGRTAVARPPVPVP